MAVAEKDTSSAEDFLEYQREKYALIAVAGFMTKEGYEVKLSVLPAELAATDLSKVGTKAPAIDFKLAKADYDYGYKIYYDTPGAVDLVAIRDGRVLLGEGKGVSKGTVQKAAKHGDRVWDLVAATIGRLVLVARPDRGETYAVVLPDSPAFVKVLASMDKDNPILRHMPLSAYLVSACGEVRRVDLPMAMTSTRVLEPGP